MPWNQIVAGLFPEGAGLDNNDEATWRIIHLPALLGGLFFLDIVTTQSILLSGGTELNPLMVFIVSSPILHAALKALILLIVFGISLVAEQMLKGSSLPFYSILIAMYLFVVSHNLMALVPRIISHLAT
ncbi:MAG: hypothetical protein A4E35_02342 [Methanoregula sp. PtaU1.Bin051]|nr:MAG: hypothetical protein A4E35_02342 [Methanoregula sp. PtaU1.Bin051]